MGMEDLLNLFLSMSYSMKLARSTRTEVRPSSTVIKLIDFGAFEMQQMEGLGWVNVDRW